MRRSHVPRFDRARALALALTLVGTMAIAAEPPVAPAGEAPEALRIEARALEHGEGVARDLSRAIALYCEAARLGDAEAQFSLGWIYANARGVTRDDRLAGYFFSLAADQGHSSARQMLRYTGAEAVDPPACMQDPAPPAEVEAPLPAFSPSEQKIVDLVLRLAPEYGVSPRLALAVIRVESNFNVGAVSPKRAQGLMQLIPETSARFNVRKPFEPEQNIRGGMAYLRWLLAYFKGQVALVVAAYNAGEGAVNRHLGIPPYAETRAYVKQIRQWYHAGEHPYDPAVSDPSPEFARIVAKLKP